MKHVRFSPHSVDSHSIFYNLDRNLRNQPVLLGRSVSSPKGIIRVISLVPIRFFSLSLSSHFHTPSWCSVDRQARYLRNTVHTICREITISQADTGMLIATVNFRRLPRSSDSRASNYLSHTSFPSYAEKWISKVDIG